MAVQKPPYNIPFGGVVTKGSPLARPPQSAIRCKNFRLMPGVGGSSPYLRLRGGKIFRMANAGWSIYKFYEWQTPKLGIKAIGLFESDGGVGSWRNIDLSTNPYTNTVIYTYPSNAGTENPCVGVKNKFLFVNGRGTRTGTESQPPMCSWDGTTVRYVGIDAYCPGGNPTAAMAIGAGVNNIIYWVDIWVGLLNTTTQHYSNAVYAGRVSTVGTGTITVSNLDRLKIAYNNTTERGELQYVFYASVDGGQTSYLILNSSLNGPLTAAAFTVTSQSLSLTSLSPQGFVLDYTQERPFENYPPRYPDCLTYGNGRVYGGFSGNAFGSPGDAHLLGPNGQYYNDFAYPVTDVGTGYVGWSATADDVSANDFVGVPEESWPLRNRKYTPDGLAPVRVESIPGTSMVLVLTGLGTYLLYEAADGLHQWVTLSDTDGVAGFGDSYVSTPRGPMWLTQRLQLVLLDRQSLKLSFLSEDFDEILSAPIYGGQAITADYIKDPHQQLDYYEVWLANASHSSVVYDFAAGGVAYTKTSSLAVFRAGSLRDPQGRAHHLLSGIDTPVYSQETDAFNGTIPTRDEITQGAPVDFTGDYVTQWMCYEDPRVRKLLTDLDAIGDGELSAQLNARPLVMSYWVDFDNSLEIPLTPEKTLQSSNDCDQNYKARLRDGNFFWIKFRFQLNGHGTEQASYAQGASATAEVPPDFYGCIYNAALTHNQGSRP